MAKKTKTKLAAADLPVPQSREEAASAVARIGEINREVARREADLNDQLARIKEQVEAALLPSREEADRLLRGLETWASANRRDLTGGEKTKTVDLGTGLIKWRLKPAKVSIRGTDAVIEAIRKMGFGKAFLRTTVDINKEAMLADKERARTVPGVTIGSDGEDFAVEPFEVELAGVV